MRLIDADQLLENIKSGDPLIFEKSIENQIRFVVDQQPTAYDVDKVVERLSDLDELTFGRIIAEIFGWEK